MREPKYKDGGGIVYKTRNNYKFGLILKGYSIFIPEFNEYNVFYEVYTEGIIYTIWEDIIISHFPDPY